MAQKIDIRISYGKNREMGRANKEIFEGLVTGFTIESADVNADGSVVTLTMTNKATVSFRTDLAVPTIVFGRFERT